MKRHICFIFMLLVAGQCAAEELKTNEWGPVTNSLKMSVKLATNTTEIKTNGLVELKILFANISNDKTFYIDSANNIEDDFSYSFQVITPFGKHLSSMPRSMIGGSAAIYTLGPHQTNQFVFNLSAVCKFDETGDYIVTANRIITVPREKLPYFTVVSNPLTIKIVP